MNILSHSKGLRLAALIWASFAAVLSSSHADGVDGHYKIAAVEDSGAGWIGDVTVKNRSFSGSVYSYFYNERLYLNGYVDKKKRLIYSPKPLNVSSITAKIRKRNKMVIGVRGSYSDVFGDTGQIVGYKRRNL